MSQWTHFIGTIQCAAPEDAVQATLGRPVLFGDSDQFEFDSPEYRNYEKNVWHKAFADFEAGHGIPMGSEGSLKWYYTDTTEGEYTALGEGSLISIEGDLRDFGDDDQIEKSINWFTRACKDLYARQAVLLIQRDIFHKVILVECSWRKCRVTVLREESEEEDE